MRWAEYEERRKRNVETVLKDLMTANSRTNYRKTTSVLNRLTMQHDERMLKTAFKQPGRQNVKRSYDLKGTDLEYKFDEQEKKYYDAKQRWDGVLERKYKETERFVKERKDNLFAKFKKEKLVKEKNMDDEEIKKDD